MSVMEIPSVEDKEQKRKSMKSIEEQNERRRGSNAITALNVQNVMTQMRFLLCHSCFWCASYIGLSSNTKTTEFIKCIICKNGKIESLPIVTSRY
jgi:hypothetical protein